MIDFNSAIAAIRDNNGFEPNKYDDSFYRLYNTSKGKIQVRISNHGTHLWTWVKNAPVNPSECLANICIVLSKDGAHNSSTTVRNGQWNGNENNPSNKPYDFEVVQYVYNCSSLSANNGNRINAFIQKIPQLCKYEDPLKNNSNKHAGVYSLKPNSAIQTIVTNSITSDPRQQVPQNISILQSGLPVATNRGMDGVDYPIEESNTRKYMKTNRIKLTESQLRNMITKAINEAYDMDRVNRWGQRNGYEMNGNTLSNGYEDMTFTDDGEFYSSSEGFPSSDFENYMQGQPVSNDELLKYISSKFGHDYRLTQAIVEDDENAMQYLANDMTEEMDCTPEEAMKALHEFANEYHYYNPSYEEDDLNEGKVAKKKTINESQLRNMIAEAINEYYDTFDIEDNPGNVKNPKVRRLGFNASYNQPGGEKMATNSRGYEYVTSKSGKDNVRDRIMKHNGGGQPWLRGVRPNENLLQMWYNISPDNEEYCKKVGSEIVRAACYSPSLYDEIKWTLEKFIQNAQNKRLYK